MFQAANIFLIITILVYIFLAIFISLQRPSFVQKLMQALAFCILIMNFGYYFSLHAESLESSVLAIKLRYVGACPIYVIFVGIYIASCKINIKRKYINFIIAYKTIMLLIILTLDQHPLYYSNISFQMQNNIPTLVRSYGFVHTIFVLETIICLLSSIVISIVQYSNSKKRSRDRSRMLTLLAATTAPFITYILHITMDDIPIDLIPVGIFISTIIFGILIFRFNLGSVKEEARSYVFDSLENAHIVVDADYYYEDSNPLAKKIFPELNQVRGEKNIQDISYFISDIFHKRKTKIIEYEDHLYQPECQELRSGERIKGYMASLIDVTEQQTYMRLLENYQKDLERDVLLKKSQIEKMQQQIIISFANIAENRDGTTGKHIKRTSAYVQLIIKELERTNVYTDILDEKYAEYTYSAAPLHDIGKVMIPDGILCKPGRLTEQEYEVIKTHTTLGGQILEDTLAAIEGDTYLEVANKVAVYHHERWDGTGYPEGLSKEDIPLCARIMAVADVFDALVSERPYKKAYSMEAAFQIISSASGTHFDPKIADAFLNIRNKIEIAFVNINEMVDDQEFAIII